MGSVIFILEEKLNVIFLFLMNLNKKMLVSVSDAYY